MPTAIKELQFNETNADLDYATHSFFRYFGKLPPSVVRHILLEGLKYNPRGPILDLMCGSGTSLVEAKLLGVDSIGVDINPLSVLVSKVKTTYVAPDALRKTFEHLKDVVVSTNKWLDLEVPRFPNVDYWFSSPVQQQLAMLKQNMDDIANKDHRDFFTVAFLGIIRKVSNASPRIGRLFHLGYDREVDVIETFFSKVGNMIAGMEDFGGRLTRSAEARAIQADARHTQLPGNQFSFIINHPPYFALYKYSSDVLRFELEWAGCDRKSISRAEIRDGFKTTEIASFEDYAEDMVAVLQEGYRLLKNRSLYCLVVNNSTLGEVRLPVVNRLTKEAKKIGFTTNGHFKRPVKFAQASYHRSARLDKKTVEDYLIFLAK